MSTCNALKTLLAAGLLAGSTVSLANLASSNAGPHACEAAAYEQRDADLSQVENDFDGNAAACYELAHAGASSSVALCLKAAEASRKDSLRDAELALSLALASCSEVL